MYGAQCWCLPNEDERRILAAEMGWLRRILKITTKDKMTNEVIHEILHQE